MQHQIGAKARPRTRALKNAAAVGESAAWESDSVLKYYFKQKGETRNPFKRNFVSTRIPKGLISPSGSKSNNMSPKGNSSVMDADRLARDGAALANYFQTGKLSREFVDAH